MPPTSSRGRRPVLVAVRPIAAVSWLFGAVAVGVQIGYPVTEASARLPATIGSVLAFAVASLCDATARFGPRVAALLAVIGGGGGLLVEAVGAHTGFPFGAYRYSGTLGPEVLGVPVVVPLAWIMMSWPALLAGRALAGWWRAERPVWLVVVTGGWALASWDVFLDPQMVDAGHWVWTDPAPALPGVSGVPLTNFAGWLLVAALMIAVLHRFAGATRTAGETDLRAGAAPLLYLWTFASSVWAHAAFFGRPSVALVGGAAMGLVAVPFAVLAWRAQR